MPADDEFLRQLNEHFRNRGADELPGEGVPAEEEEPTRRGRELNEREVKVVGVYQHAHGGAFVVVRDSRSRNLPIWIGEAEAYSIALAIEGSATPRPMTHDLTKLLVERLGGNLQYILVDDLYNNVYYAKLVLEQREEQVEIDCRPSDAIALALRFKAPIYVADAVLDEGQWEVSEE
ncbi:MAG: bifunctional nuclease family protein [Armatimonadota bacterium]